MKTTTPTRYKTHQKKIQSVANTAINKLYDELDNTKLNYYNQTTTQNIATSTDLLAYHLLQQSLTPSQRSTLLDALDFMANSLHEQIADSMNGLASSEERKDMQKTLTIINQLERLIQACQNPSTKN